MLPDGIVVVVKRSCPTCQLVTGVLDRLERGPAPLTVYAQDDTDFRPGTRDDTELEISFAYDIDTVPTVLRVEGGEVVGRTEGWRRDRWEEITGAHPLGTDLPEWRPGCGSRTHDPDVQDALTIARLEPSMQARRIELGSDEDDAEAMFARGWSDGLPLVPPTLERVARMLAATPRDPQDLVAVIPPDLVDCTVEKVAINAVMAGCRPEYLPVVLTAVEAACTDEFNMHGVLATTWFSGPMVIVNGPITRALGMNSGVNALGQGNRANATIGRALQLVVRNVGGGRPGEVDRATLGTPGKYTFCFAEDEAGIAVGAAARRTRSAADRFGGHVVRGRRCARRRGSVVAGTGIAGALVRERAPNGGASEERDRVGRGSRRLARARSRLPRCRVDEAPPAEGAGRAVADPRLGDRAGRRRHRGRHARRVPRFDAAEVPRGWAPDRARRWRCRALLRDHRRVGERRGRQ